MPIRVVCPQCGKALNAPDTAAGKVANCPECKGKISIPGAPTGAAVAPMVAQAARPAFPVAVAAAAMAPPVASVAPPLPVAKPVILPAILVGGPPVLPSTAPASDPMAAFALETFGGSTQGGIALGAQPLATSPLAARPRRNSGSLLPLLIIAGSVLGAGVLIGGVYWLTSGRGAGDWMKWMPDNAQVVAHINMKTFLPYIEDFKRTNPQVQQELDKLVAESRMTPEEITSVSIGVGQISGGTPAVVGVIQKNSAVTDANIGKATGARSEQVGEYTIYYSANDEAIGKVDEYTVIAGQPEAVKAVLSRNGPPKLSPALERALNEADFSADVAVAANLQGLAPAGAMPMPGALDPSKLEGVAVSADLGSSISLEGTLLCIDSNTAAQLKTQADQAMQMLGPRVAGAGAQAPGVQEAWDSISIGRSGARLTFSVTIPESLIEQAKQQASGFGPPRAGPSGFGGGGFNNGF